MRIYYFLGVQIPVDFSLRGTSNGTDLGFGGLGLRVGGEVPVARMEWTRVPGMHAAAAMFTAPVPARI